LTEMKLLVYADIIFVHLDKVDAILAYLPIKKLTLSREIVIWKIWDVLLVTV
jgi:hypothetical protein